MKHIVYLPAKVLLRDSWSYNRNVAAHIHGNFLC